MDFRDLQYSEDFKLNFLACHILDFYKSYVLLDGRFSYLIIYTQRVVSMFGSTNYCENETYSKMKHVKSTLR